MPTVRPSQRSFNAGMLTSWLGSRGDLEKYKSGLKYCLNFLLTPFGPLRRRMGFQFSNQTKFSGERKSRVIGFQASSQEGYCIELGHLYMRFHKVCAPVVDGESIYEIVTPWTEDQLSDIHYESVNDVTFFVHPDVPVQVLSYFSETDWEIEPMAFDFPPMMDENLTSTTLEITASTDVPIDYDTTFVVTVPGSNITSEELLCDGAYEVVVNSLTAGIGPGEYFRLQQSVDGGATWTTRTTITAAGNYTGTFSGVLRLIANDYEVDSTLATQVDSPEISVGDLITVEASSSIFTADMVGTFFAMTQPRDKTEVRLYMRNIRTSESLPVSGGYTLTTTGLWAGDLVLERSRDNGSTWEKIIAWRGDKDRNISYSSTEKSPVLLRMRFAGGDEDSKYATLEADDPNQEGVFLITEYNSPTSVDGEVVLPFVSMEATTIWRQGAWGAASGYPRTVQWHANRLTFGGSRQEPGMIWFSGIEDYYNYKDGTDDDDPFRKSLGGTQQETIQWLASKGVLAVGTTGGEWIGVNGDDQNIVTPAGFGISLQSGNGGSRQMAVVANNTILFVQHTGRKVREFSYSVTDNSFGGLDMTQLCIDVTEGGIIDSCLQRQRDTTLWVTTGTGKLASMIYERTQGVIGWGLHDTQGLIESVASVFESGEEDSIYVTVKREVAGNPVRYVERMVPGQFQLIEDGNLAMMPYMDSFRTFDGTSTSPGFTDLTDFFEKLQALTPSSNTSLVNGFEAIKAAADQIVWTDNPGVTKAIIMLTDTANTGISPDATAVQAALLDKDIVLSQGPDFAAFATNAYTAIVTATGGETWAESEINTNSAIFNAITSLFATPNDRLELCFIIDKLATPADTINFQAIIAALKAQIEAIDTNLQTRFDSIGYSLVSVNALGYVFETVASPTTESIITGLDHLIGETVQILADGVVLPEQVVTISGTVTLPEAAAVVHVGLGYTSIFETLPVTIQLNDGDSTGKTKRIADVLLRTYRSVEAETAPRRNYQGTWEVLKYSTRNPVDFNPPIALGAIGDLEQWTFQMQLGNSDDAQFAARVNNPVPLNILEIQPTVEISN